MRGLPVDVQLVVLIVVYEAATFLEYSEVGIISLRQLVQVVAVRQLRPYFHRLPIARVELPHRVDVRPVALLTTLAQPHLRLTEVALQVIMHHIEVLERRELRIRW